MGHTYGLNAVDWERRLDTDALRQGRLARAKQALDESGLGALILFDMANIRYVTSTTIGIWATDKLARFALLPRDSDPLMWDFGSAARHHQLYCPWISGDTAAGISTMRGAFSPESGRAQDVAAKIRRELEARGLADQPLGIDVAEPEVMFALQAAGLKLVDGQQLMQRTRMVKTAEEVIALDTACMMVDAAYDELYRSLKPGMRENECVGLVSRVLYDLGSEHVEGVNAISGERCSPHPHIFSDRALRPGDPAYFDIIHSYLGYRTCYYRTFVVGSGSRAQADAYRRCRDILDEAIALIRPGRTTKEIAESFPRAQEFGFPDEEAAFALQFGHGVGLGVWEKPIISRLVSLDHPETLVEGMVFAIETFWPAADGWSAARIEEQLVVTADGCEILTRFPAEELMVAGQTNYFTVKGALPATRETQSHRNNPAFEPRPDALPQFVSS
jgi:Xaa-Pro aminopeptidase